MGHKGIGQFGWSPALIISLLGGAQLGGAQLGGAPLSQAVIASPNLSSDEQCSPTFEPFIHEMLAELPAYANRVHTRSNNRQTYVVLASRADFEDLPLWQVSFPASESLGADVEQVFFSTLLRRFSETQVVHHQEHHWLLMAPSDRGWEFVQMYSILDSYPAQNLAAPPRNSSNGSIATAIKDWLKNCHTNI